MPVLPLTINCKLSFPLCYTCARDKTEECTHHIEGRVLKGTWTTIELKEALKQGYNIIDIIEVLNYKKTSNELFSGFINTWLKVKQESSGWPSWCQSETDKQQYITNYKERENIDLEYDKITKNPGLRYIAKIMLNSFWGKFAQRPNLPKTEVINCCSEFWDIANDNNKEIIYCFMITENVMIINWKYKEEGMCKVKDYSLAIASYVTAYARLELYNLMKKIEEIRPYSLLYHDTDSVLYVEHKDDPKIECGDFLGELTDEISQNETCIEFVSLGPKSYGYITKDKTTGKIKTILKLKGIAMNTEAEKILSFDNLKVMIEKYIENKDRIYYKIPQSQINCTLHQELLTRKFDKVFKLTSDKRKIIDGLTYPYGFKRIRT